MTQNNVDVVAAAAAAAAAARVSNCFVDVKKRVVVVKQTLWEKKSIELRKDKRTDPI